MAAYSNFRSSSQIETEREGLREARKAVLEKAKHDYEKSERRREKARQAGEGTWMLPSLNDRIDKEEKALEKAKKKKEKKKKKKHKKEKKKRRESSSSESESAEEENSWVEKSSDQTQAKPVAGPTLQRDGWMDGPLVTDLIPTVTRQELRDRRKTEEEKKKAETVNLMEQPGQHSKELNPYWKDGGQGVPENKPKTSGPSAAGDGGLAWLRKGYDRCKQQAADEGRSLEEVAAERYGSLEKLESMIREAERSSGKGSGRRTDPGFRREDRSYRRSRSPDHRDSNTGRIGDREGGQERHSTRDHNRDFSDRRRGREEDRGSSERSSNRRDSGRDRDGDRDGRAGDSSRASRDGRDRPPPQKRQFARPMDDSDDDKPSVKARWTFQKPGEGIDRSGDRNERPKSSGSSLTGRFARPADSDDEDANLNRGAGRRQDYSDRGSSRNGGGGGGSRGWRKPGPKEEKPGRRSPPREGRRRRRSSSASSRTPSSSSSSSESSEHEEEEKTVQQEEPAPVMVKVLSEDEMNSLGAKILRAELMGDDDLAKQLKAQLEQAQQAKDAAPKAPPGPKDTAAGKVKGEDEDVVVLTRTGRDGMVRPLPEQEYDRDRSRKRQKKMKNTTTHGREGERTKYFDDDDRHDLKTLVHMEKLGTAEDQNSMFARLAGRSTEQTNDDFQVDDLFLSKAARQQSGARNEEKERSKAIFEHRKINTAMEKCQFCFNKIPKHLIIAIGNKVYLSLPAHRSLTPGHCLIVPMQHCSAATALDEDVWQEMQLFRKQLVQMFAAQDEDVVFMETSMHLRHFPHMIMECIPVEKEIGDMAPIYFKKAMMEAGPEWNSNKKVVDLSKKDIRHSVPKAFPYFSVDFGLQGGFAHVIEEEATFPAYFGREIVGGMIDAEPGLWRKPHREGFEDQRKKVLEFAEWWKPYDFTASS